MSIEAMNDRGRDDDQEMREDMLSASGPENHVDYDDDDNEEEQDAFWQEDESEDDNGNVSDEHAAASLI